MTSLDTIDTTARASNEPSAAARRPAIAWTTAGFTVSVACLFLVLAAAFMKTRLADAVVPWDSKNHFYPMFRFLADALRGGAIPFWNPYHFSGYPAIADPQSMIFTPSMMLFALLAPDASMPLFDGVIMLHLFFGGIGVLCLARRWGWHPAAGLFSALIFTLGGAAAARLEHTGMIISYIYFPWALWSLQGALTRRSLAWGLLAGLTVALMALGRDQVAFLQCLALVAVVAWEASRTGSPVKYLLGRAPVLVVAGLVTIALMIVPILLTLQFVHDSNRPSITYGVALSGSLNPINLLTLISPDVFGSVDRPYGYWGPGTGYLVGNDWTDRTDRTMDYMFIGTIPAVLLVWQGLAAGRLLERGMRVFALMFAFILFYAVGRYTPVFGLFFDWIPGVSLYRRPADANFAINIAMALGAGVLLQRFITEGLARGRTWVFSIATLIGCALLVGGGLAFGARYGHLIDTLRHFMASMGLAAIAVGVLWTFGRSRHRTVIAVLLVMATAGDLLWRNVASPLNAEPIAAYSPYSGLNPAETRGLAVLRADLARRAADGEHPRVELIGLTGSWQNASIVLKLENTIGYNPLRISDYERAVGPVESATDIDLRQFPGLFRGYNGRMASLLGLDYLVLDRSLDRLPRQFPRPRADLLFASENFFVYRLLNEITPRATFTSHVQFVHSDDVIDDEHLPPFDPSRDTLIDAKDAPAIRETDLLTDKTKPLARGSKSTVAITAYEDNAITLSVDAAMPGVVVLHDLAYPGWTVTVDGRTAPLLRADILFRGVEVPLGHHNVQFVFKPLSFANLTAAAVSLAQRTRR